MFDVPIVCCIHVLSCHLLKVLCNLLAVDGVNDPDVLAINAGEFLCLMIYLWSLLLDLKFNVFYVFLH